MTLPAHILTVTLSLFTDCPGSIRLPQPLLQEGRPGGVNLPFYASALSTVPSVPLALLAPCFFAGLGVSLAFHGPLVQHTPITVLLLLVPWVLVIPRMKIKRHHQMTAANLTKGNNHSSCSQGNQHHQKKKKKPGGPPEGS